MSQRGYRIKWKSPRNSSFFKFNGPAGEWFTMKADAQQHGRGQEESRTVRAQAAHERATAPPQPITLYFQDDARHFLGLAIVEAHGISSAIMRAHELGIAPGRGVVLQFAVPPHDVSQRDRLLGADEALPLLRLLQARA